ncbi:MAG: hypothetical protein ACOY0T_01450 [Myxococcota bacterium]
MTDEFPTLEVVQAVCVLWLGFRGFHLFRGVTQLNAKVERLAHALEKADASAQRGVVEPWLVPLSRTTQALVTHQIGATAARELLSERSARARRKLRSGAARDLVVCAILIGALIYARAAKLDVSVAFFGLGVAAAVLLLLAVALRLKLERGLVGAATRLAEAMARHQSAPNSGALSRCRICSETKLTRVAGSQDLGPNLSSLGVMEVFVCPRCGHVTGAAHTSAA